MIVLSHRDVEELLSVRACIDVMAQALEGLGRGEFHQPLRSITGAPGALGLLALMPAYASPAGAPETSGAYAVKAVTFFPGNSALGLDTHQGGVLLFSGATGELLAVANASAITAIRTAAVSGVATRLLARPDAGDLGLVGAGIQADTHLEAMHCVRTLRRVRVAAKSFDRAEAFVHRAQARYPFPIEAVENAEAAVRGADLIVTVTSATEPILRREWIADGAHLNVVGSSQASKREVDGATMAAASLFVDRRESTINESGDYLFALREGAIGADHIRAELGELLLGLEPGRQSDSEITLFKSLGLAIEDLAAARYLLAAALATNAGARIDF